MQELKESFNGSFDKMCQENSAPSSLLCLVNMILYGPNIESQSNSTTVQSALSIAQLMQYNSFVRRCEGILKRERHNKNKEMPLPVYIGLSIHVRTWSRDLVDTFYDLGLSVSYDRVLSISTDLGNSVCKRFEMDQVVCPTSLRKGLSTTAAVDNIDHNPSSTSSKNSFHGTGISLFQHTSAQFPGEEQEAVTLEQTTSGTKAVSQLPQSFTNLPPVVLQNKDPPVPQDT